MTCYIVKLSIYRAYVLYITKYIHIFFNYMYDVHNVMMSKNEKNISRCQNNDHYDQCVIHIIMTASDQGWAASCQKSRCHPSHSLTIQVIWRSTYSLIPCHLYDTLDKNKNKNTIETQKGFDKVGHNFVGSLLSKLLVLQVFILQHVTWSSPLWIIRRFLPK